jgi:hypothetical protein
MDQDHPQANFTEPLLAAWIKWTMDFWESMTHMGPAHEDLTGGTDDFWQAALKMWQAFFSLLSEPETVAAVFKGIRPPSEIIVKMAQAGWAGYFHLHQQWLEGGAAKDEPPSEAYGFENLDQDIFKICTEIYEKDFRQLLNLPQVGLTCLPGTHQPGHGPLRPVSGRHGRIHLSALPAHEEIPAGDTWG